MEEDVKSLNFFAHFTAHTKHSRAGKHIEIPYFYQYKE